MKTPHTEQFFRRRAESEARTQEALAWLRDRIERKRIIDTRDRKHRKHLYELVSNLSVENSDSRAMLLSLHDCKGCADQAEAVATCRCGHPLIPDHQTPGAECTLIPREE